MNGSLSLRFDSVLGEDARAEVATRLTLQGARLTSWSPQPAVGRTYAQVEFEGGCPAESLRSAIGAARVDEPPLIVLDVQPREPGGRTLARLLEALTGPAAPAGVVGALATERGLVVELDPAKSSLALVVDLIDVELHRGNQERTITPLLPLSDQTLASLAAWVLAAPEIDATRLIETYTEPLIRTSAS